MHRILVHYVPLRATSSEMPETLANEVSLVRRYALARACGGTV